MIAADYVIHDLVNAHNVVVDGYACCAVYAYRTDLTEGRHVDALREQYYIQQ